MLEFNLKQLEVFAAVAELNSFSRAAQRLYLTQSTVSAHIQALERALGQPLFLREAKKCVRLTPAGAAVYPLARDILTRCRALQQAVRPSEDPGELTLAASTVPCKCLLPELMAGFLAFRPGVRYVLKKGDSAQVHQWLRSREARIGFVGAKLDAASFDYQPLLQDKLVLLTPNTARFQAQLRRGALGRELLTEPMIVREPGSGTRQRFDAYLRQLGVDSGSLQMVAQIEQPEAILGAVESGMGVAVYSELAAREALDAGRVLSFELEPGSFYRSLYLVTLPEQPLTPPEQAFAEFVQRQYPAPA